MTPRKLLELTDSYWLHEWLIPLTFIGVAIMVLTLIIVTVILFIRELRQRAITKARVRKAIGLK